MQIYKWFTGLSDWNTKCLSCLCSLKNSTRIMSCCKKLDSTVHEHRNDGNEEQQQAEDMEQQLYESLKFQESGDGKYHIGSQEWEHLEGARHQQPDGEDLKPVFGSSIRGTPRMKTPFPSQTSVSLSDSPTGSVARTSSPNVETPSSSSTTQESSYITRMKISWMKFKAAISCCFWFFS